MALLNCRACGRLAESKLVVYRENREILLEVLEQELGQHREYFGWTLPDGGFFTVFSFLAGRRRMGLYAYGRRHD